jgi:hypothetical protein
VIGQRDHTESLDCNWRRGGKLLRLLNRIRSALRDGWHDPVTHYSDVAWRLRLRALFLSRIVDGQSQGALRNRGWD